MLLAETGFLHAQEIKLSVFNFGTANIEASGLGTSVTNALISNLSRNPSISILDRKDLETFLNLNDLQQNDQLDNVVNIGSRLGLDFIVVGSVAKRGSAITVKCGLVQIDKRKEVYSTQVRAQGESALSAEIAKLASLITSVLTKSSTGPESTSAPGTGGGPGAGAPVNFKGVPGNKKIILRWQPVPGFAAAGYEVYRALNANGPFAMLGQTDKTEFADQNVENDISYFYRIRAYDRLSRLSDYTPVVSARTDFAPNPPIILKTEGRAKSMLIVWTPNPAKSVDPSPLVGYKIYRAAEEDGSYQEVNKLLISDLADSGDGKIYYRATGLPDGQTFFYRLAAYNAKGIESELSHPVKGTTLPIVSSVNASGQLIREVKLTWAGISSPFLTAYNIYRSTKSDGGFLKIKRISAAENTARYEYSDTEGLGDNTPYYYTVTAEDDLKAETSPSAVVAATTRDIPPRPEKFTARGGLVKKVELTWQAAPQPEVEGYYIFWSTEKNREIRTPQKDPGARKQPLRGRIPRLQPPGRRNRLLLHADLLQQGGRAKQAGSGRRHDQTPAEKTDRAERRLYPRQGSASDLAGQSRKRHSGLPDPTGRGRQGQLLQHRRGRRNPLYGRQFKGRHDLSLPDSGQRRGQPAVGLLRCDCRDHETEAAAAREPAGEIRIRKGGPVLDAQQGSGHFPLHHLRKKVYRDGKNRGIEHRFLCGRIAVSGEKQELRRHRR